MNKFTPGPWKQIRWNDDCHIVEVNESTEWTDFPNKYIAKIGGWGYAGNGNKHLIAAAPEMYEALEAAYNMLEDGGELLFTHFHEIVLPLLKKARGEF